MRLTGLAVSALMLSVALNSLHAQATAGPSSPVATPLLGATPGPFIALSVADLDRQVAWYRDTLGFVVSAQGTVGPRRIPYAHLRQGSIFLELMQWPGARPLAAAVPGATDPVEVLGFFKSGIVVSDVAALFRHFQSTGVKFEYELRQHSADSRSFGLRDPEGNLWQFFGS